MHDARATSERRVQPEMRAIFPAACEALRPFFDPAYLWDQQIHEHFAYRALKELFPQLTSQESFIVVMTAKRLFSEGRMVTAR